MRTWTETRREGTDVGPVDWSYDVGRDVGYTSERDRPRYEKRLAWLREIEDDPESFQVSNYGGWPRLWRDAIRVRLYDGWPYWRPIPAVLTRGPLGPEWVFYMSLTGARNKETGEALP